MKEFIWKKFVKDYENIRNPEVRARYTRLTGAMGIAVNTSLCVVKIILGLAISSIAVVADGIHDMADSLAACITLIGAHVAKKPADEGHPYGHARAEYVASLIVSSIILIVGYQLMKTSVGKVLHPEETLFSWYMVGFMVFAILLKGSSSLFTIATGKRIDSLPVIAAGTDNRNDVITSIIIVIGMSVHHFTGYDLDGYMGCIVSLFILWSGFTLIRETVDQLLGSPPDEKTLSEMREIILSHDAILGIHDMIVYNYGPGQSYATFHAEVDSREDIMKAHDAIDHIEREIYDKLGIRVTCHMDPVVKGDPKHAALEHSIAESLREFEMISGFHDLRLSPDEDDPGRDLLRLDVTVAPGHEFPKEDIIEAIHRAVVPVAGPCRVVVDFDQAYTVTGGLA